jgi:hypothetical protein
LPAATVVAEGTSMSMLSTLSELNFAIISDIGSTFVCGWLHSQSILEN